MTAAPRRILLVEDEALIALDAQDVLEQAGYSVVGPALTLGDAVRLASEPLDAGILDVSLAGQLVWPAADVLRSHGVPLVLLTGFGAALDVPERFRDVPRLAKPIDATLLSETLAGLLG
jgi:DNA-binding response OmpR family regulator